MKKFIELTFYFLLSLLGGLFDGYSLLFRGGRFCCIQTGNLVYIGIDLANNNFEGLILPSILFVSFIFGLFFTKLLEIILIKYNKEKFLHLILILIMSILLIPNYFFEKSNGITLEIICPILLSINGAILIQAFANFKFNFAPTMMTNNTKLMVNNLISGIKDKNKIIVKKSLLYLIIILFFILGVFLSVLITDYLNQHSIFMANIILIILLILEIYKLNFDTVKN